VVRSCGAGDYDPATGYVTLMRAPISLSLHLPNFNYPGVEPDGLFEKLVEIATAAEDSGYSGVTVMDHLHQIAGVGPRTNSMLEGTTALSALAARTSRLNLGLLVGGVMYRNPALLAKITTTMDVLSGGRAFLGIGAAWFEEEHRAYGFDFPPLRERFEHLEDALQIARLMFTQPESSFTGRHHSTHDVLNIPQPLRGDIPILIGGSGERKTLRLVAKYADGCNIFGDIEHVKHLLGVLEDHCEDVGRDPAEITKTRMATVFVESSHEAAVAKLEATGLDERRAPMAIAGDPDGVAEQAQALVDAGIEGLTISLPDVHDTAKVALAGQALAPVMGAPV
jgi:F420-dependent oxidoreductase-like protein